MSQILVGDDLHKSFGLTQALRGASIVLDEGEIVAVMGPSGSGKSTLLHCLAGMLTPDRGEVQFGGARFWGLSTCWGSLCPNCRPWRTSPSPCCWPGDAASRHSRPPRRGSRDWTSTASASGYPASSPEVRASGLRWHGRWS